MIFRIKSFWPIQCIAGYCYKYTCTTEDWFCAPGSHIIYNFTSTLENPIIIHYGSKYCSSNNILMETMITMVWIIQNKVNVWLNKWMHDLVMKCFFPSHLKSEHSCPKSHVIKNKTHHPALSRCDVAPLTSLKSSNETEPALRLSKRAALPTEVSFLLPGLLSGDDDSW